MHHPHLGRSTADTDAVEQVDTTMTTMEINHMKRYRPMGGVKKLRFGVKRDRNSTFQSRVAALKEIIDQLSTSDLQALYAHVAPPASPRGEFDNFRKLPLELRLMIWRAAMPPQRVVELLHHLPSPHDCNEDNLDQTPEDWEFTYPVIYNDPKQWIIRCHAKPSVILQVCQESREEALKKYTLRVDTKLRKCFTRIDPINDIIYIPWYEDYIGQRKLVYHQILKKDAYKSIKHLAVCLDIWQCPEVFSSTATDDPNTLGKFTALEDFTLVVHYDCDREWGHDRTSEFQLVEKPVEDMPTIVPGRPISEEVSKLEIEFALFRKENPGCGARKLKWAVLTLNGEPCCLKPPVPPKEPEIEIEELQVANAEVDESEVANFENEERAVTDSEVSESTVADFEVEDEYEESELGERPEVIWVSDDDSSENGGDD